LLDKTLVDEVRVAKVFGVAGLLSLALLPIPIRQAAHFYPPNCLHVRWHFGCRTEREQGCIFGNGPDHEIESITGMIDPAPRDALQDIEIS
jgi:hypothetical protein